LKSLFDNINRDYIGPAQRSEPTFTWLNRSAKPACDKIRQQLETWFSHYPAEHQNEMYTRLRRDDRRGDFDSAFFELFLHELLLKLGCCPIIHPTVNSNNGRCPDFLVESPKGNFYMEAVLVREPDDEIGARTRMNQVYDILDRNLKSPNFFIGMDIIGTPDTAPPARQITNFLAINLTSVDPDTLYTQVQKAQNYDVLPRWKWKYQNWEIVFYPIPKSPNLRGKPDVRPIGMQFDGFHWLDLRTPIRDRIMAKAKRYGRLDLPYVIALNDIRYMFRGDQIDIMEALFGKETFRVSRLPSEATEPEMIREMDGAWTSPSGPRYSSAVIFIDCLLPWNISKANINLYHNPWAEKPYTSELCCLHQAIPNHQEDKMEFISGKTLGEIFNLSKNWPE
jgi:hypothetical protein